MYPSNISKPVGQKLLLKCSKLLYYNNEESSFGSLPEDVISVMKALSVKLFLKKYKIK